MKKFLFLGDSITDADHLFDSHGLGHGYVAKIAACEIMSGYQVTNRGHNGFTTEQLLRLLKRDGIEADWDVITLLIGVNDIPVEVYTSHNRIPMEFEQYYREILEFLTTQTTAQLILAEPFLFDKPAEYIPWHSLLEKEGEIIRKLASLYHAHFLPTDHCLRTEALLQGVDLITSDGIHLTSRGSQLLADLWLTVCRPLLP